MKNLFYILLVIGTAFTTACSTNATNEKSDEPAAAEAPANTTSTDTASATEATATGTPAAQNESSSSATSTGDSSSSTSYGNDIVYTCTHGDSVRTIRVLYHEQGPTVCEVTYEKSTGTQSLWSANSDESYCADKAAGFVAKQQGWGWDCNK